MPNSKKPRQVAARTSTTRHNTLEARRDALLMRLQNLDGAAKSSRGYRSTLVLLNQKYRKASLAARLGILQAAAFMIEVLELLPPV
jgi:vacuolar-type H+-ATPase subunit D/Vma8